jgi:hypothetical protein
MKFIIRQLAVLILVVLTLALRHAFGENLATNALVDPAKSIEELKHGKSETPAATTTTNAEKAVGQLPEWKLEDQASFALTNRNVASAIALNPDTSQDETIMSIDGTVFTGQVKDGRPHGYGALSTPNGTRQRGVWRNGEDYRISGTLVCPDGTVEVGTWNRDGTKSGGTITWTDGQKYEGEWKLQPGSTPELPHGKGTMKWPDGRVYVGQFEDGLMEGRGKMTYPNGKVEEGIWRLGRFTGTAPPR